jgi:hypothetical protein
MAGSERFKLSSARSQRCPSAQNVAGRLPEKGADKRPLLGMGSIQREVFGDCFAVVVVEALRDVVGEQTGDESAANLVESLHR